MERWREDGGRSQNHVPVRGGEPEEPQRCAPGPWRGSLLHSEWALGTLQPGREQTGLTCTCRSLLTKALITVPSCKSAIRGSSCHMYCEVYLVGTCHSVCTSFPVLKSIQEVLNHTLHRPGGWKPGVNVGRMLSESCSSHPGLAGAVCALHPHVVLFLSKSDGSHTGSGPPSWPQFN